jgi:hypothetical protein
MLVKSSAIPRDHFEDTASEEEVPLTVSNPLSKRYQYLSL